MNLSKEQEVSSYEQIFRVLWSMAIIFHQVSFAGFPTIALGLGFWSSALIDIGINLTSCLVLLNPRKNSAFASLLVMIISRCIYDLPLISNHIQILTLTSITLLIELVLRKKLPVISLRLTTIIVYFYVTLHKLNAGFFSLPGSCANRFGNAVLSSFLPPELTSAAISLLPTTVVLAEATLIILLCSKRWNYLGIVLGFTLHFFLGLDVERRFFNFSALMFALLYLFQSEKLIQQSFITKNNSKPLAFVIRLLSSPKFRVGIALTLFTLQFGLTPGNSESIRLFSFISIVRIWFLISLLLTTLTLLFSRPTEDQNNIRISAPIRTYFIPILIAIIGMGPYLGFRTRLSLDMYSNLKVENNQSNHLFLPSLDLWGYLRDSVTITKSSDLSLQNEYVGTSLKMAGLEFDRYLVSHPLESIEYIRGGEELNSQTAGKPGLSLLEKKLLVFRPIQKIEEPNCQW